jgi:predicted component of type VI protein secretion system
MIIEVVDANGQLPDAPIQATFGREGGTIGRAPTNRLALPGTSRTVSRIHAQIVQRKNGMKIISRSTNPLLINGHMLEIGEETELVDGAMIVIGDYSLRASGT